MPLSDRDYMKNEPPRQQPRRPFRPPSRISINPLLVLVAINALFFVATLIAPEGRYPWGEFREIIVDRVTYFLALIPYYVADRPWTLVTSIFIHADFLHILFNMFALFIFGQTLRRFIGDNTFLLVFFAGGIVGNLLFWGINQDELIFAVGASGAVYAIAGALVVLVPRMRIALWGIIPMPLWVFVAIFLGILSIPGVAPSNVAWEAHLGGLATGLVFGYFFRRRLKFMIY